VIEAGCVIGDHVTIGENSFLHANVTVYNRVQIGARVIIHSGAVIGADGFGFALVDGHYRKFPQVGTVDIQDDVEIGAGCCIDRAALGVTRIGRGTKLDNLVHVAHNCLLGQDVVVAAQTGFSGSVTVGDYAMIGGQAGIGEKANIEARAVVGGKAGILTSATVHAGEPVWGIPARPLRQHLKGLANVNKLPELKARVNQLEQQLRSLEGLLRGREG
jgi:UDP-3-O-[3-hydroxymyristoyl] glucosamine N-acyltransferase